MTKKSEKPTLSEAKKMLKFLSPLPSKGELCCHECRMKFRVEKYIEGLENEECQKAVARA